MRRVLTLSMIEAAIRASWGRDTSDDPEEWSLDNPSRGQCDVTALVVNDLVGGELLSASVYLHGERVEGHMWNRLTNGLELDLTREQFKRGEVVGSPFVRARTPEIASPDHPRYHRYELYLALSERVLNRLRTI